MQIEADTKAKEGGNDQAVLRVQAAVEVTKAEQQLLTATARITAVQGAAKLEQVWRAGCSDVVEAEHIAPCSPLCPPFMQERLTDVARAAALRATEEQRGKMLAPATVAAEIARTEAEGR